MTRGLWDRETVALMLIAAYAPLALFWLWYGGGDAIARLGVAILVLGFWHLVFLLARAQPPSLSAVITAVAMAMLSPEDLGILQLVLGFSFGAVMGELVFGGWGRNVVNPATVAISFLAFGFPVDAWPVYVAPVVWAAIPAALIGMSTGVLPSAVLLSAAALGAGAAGAGVLPESALPAAGIVLVLLVADPVTCATTTLGRLLNGALFAGLLVLFAGFWHGADPVQIAVAAALLTSLAVPSLDDAVIALWIANRRRRHGRT